MKFTVRIDRERCKGCALCVGACGRHALHMSTELNHKGVRFAEHADEAGCDGCRRCVDLCPDSAIYVQRNDQGTPVEGGD